MKVLIFGAKGWIGTQLTQLLTQLGHTCVVAETHIDCPEDDNYMKVYNEIEAFAENGGGGTHVISCLGRTYGPGNNSIDYLQDKLHDNIKDNLYAPVILAEVCQHIDVHFTYIGTGCIFNGPCDYAFTESDKPNFFGSHYSTVKGFTEELVDLMTGGDALILRIRMPITGVKHPRNFITKIVGYKQICSMDNSMTVLDDLLPIVADMMQDKEHGIYNLVNPGIINHNQILNMYRKIVDTGHTWTNISLAEQDGILACKRSNNRLDTTKLERYIIKKYGQDMGVAKIRELDIGASVERVLHKYKGEGDSAGTGLELRGLDVGGLEFANKVILVTGGCGFIGSNFINYMFGKYGQHGLRIINLDALYYCASETHIDEWIRNSPSYKFIKCNIQQLEFVEYIFQCEKPDYIIHFAAQSHVDNSFNGDESMSYTMDNVLGTHVIMECCRRYISRLGEEGRGVKIIHVSTDEVYGESMIQDKAEKHEQSLLCPTNPYAATKAGAEMIVMSYKHSFKLPVIISRCNNVYGPNQYPEKLIPKWFGLLKDGKALTIAGKGEQVRGFLWVDDVCRAFETVLIKGVVGEIYNIGSVEEYSVMDVARIMLEMVHGEGCDIARYIEYIADRPFNDMRYFISNDKMRALGWTAEMGFRKGLERLFNTVAGGGGGGRV